MQVAAFSSALSPMKPRAYDGSAGWSFDGLGLISTASIIRPTNLSAATMTGLRYLGKIESEL